MNLESTSSADNSQYLIHAKAEIVYVLRAVMQKTELVTAYINQGNDFVLTSILEVDPDSDSLILDYGASENSNQKALKAEKIVFATTQDKVRVQFVATRMESVNFKGREAFRVKLPKELLKLQRREYYRLTTPVANPIKCLITISDGGKAEVTIVDISVGGIGVVCYDQAIELEPDTVYEGCRIVLPEIGTVITNLAIRTTFEVTLKNGNVSKRSGCEFVNISGGMQAMIQRYILKLDRDRRAKLAGQ